MSDETVLSQLRKELFNPHYAIWNATSINHAFITSMGVNGKEARDVALSLLDGYAYWKWQAEDNKAASDTLKVIIGNLRLFDPSRMTREELCNAVYHTTLMEKILAGTQ